jgi:hypothetical protein
MSPSANQFCLSGHIPGAKLISSWCRERSGSRMLSLACASVTLSTMPLPSPQFDHYRLALVSPMTRRVSPKARPSLGVDGGNAGPLAPSIERTEYSSSGAFVHGAPVAAAFSYQLELSDENARSWQPLAVLGRCLSSLSHGSTTKGNIMHGSLRRTRNTYSLGS